MVSSYATLFLLLSSCLSGWTLASKTTNTKNLRGLEGDEDCIPPRYFSNAGGGGVLRSFKIIAGPESLGENFHGFAYPDNGPIDRSIGGNLQGFPERVFQNYKYPWGNTLEYIFDTCTDGQEYEITLGFADIQHACGSYTRSMNIKINGELWVTGLNLVNEVGCDNAYVITTTAFPVGNTISIEFSKATSTSYKPIVSMVSVQPIVEESRRHLKECQVSKP